MSHYCFHIFIVTVKSTYQLYSIYLFFFSPLLNFSSEMLSNYFHLFDSLRLQILLCGQQDQPINKIVFAIIFIVSPFNFEIPLKGKERIISQRTKTDELVEREFVSEISYSLFLL